MLISKMFVSCPKFPLQNYQTMCINFENWKEFTQVWENMQLKYYQNKRIQLLLCTFKRIPIGTKGPHTGAHLFEQKMLELIISNNSSLVRIDLTGIITQYSRTASFRFGEEDSRNVWTWSESKMSYVLSWKLKSMLKRYAVSLF